MAEPDSTLFLIVLHPPTDLPQIRLGEGSAPLVLGRSTEVLPYDPNISRRHAEIRWERGRHVLRDLGSTQGTFVNGQLCHERLLEDGDRIQMGGVLLRVSREIVYIQEVQYRGTDTDGLTGVLNEHGFDVFAREAIASGEPFALIGADLDRFKMFNDVFGHLIGDMLLRRVAWAFSEALPQDAALARPGGDGFAAIVTGVGPNDLRPLAQSMRESFRNHMVDYRHDPLYDSIPDAERRPYDQTVRLGAVSISDPFGWTVRRVHHELDAVLADARRAPDGVVPVVVA